MSEWNFIGDIHGDMKSLEKLSKVMPKAPFFSLGDMVDRGPKSKQVIDFFMQDGNKAVLGNHEHFMLDFYFDRKLYDKGIWFYPGNGGFHTARSFNSRIAMVIKDHAEEMRSDPYTTLTVINDLFFDKKENVFPTKVIEWLDSLPVYYEEPGLFISHAPRAFEDLSFIGNAKEHTARECRDNLLWNISPPVPIEGIIQIHGHVVYKQPKSYTVEGKVYGFGIDTWRGKKTTLTGLHWPSMQTFSVMVD